MLQFKCH
ncbi:hypothetical protein NXF25_019001 [Crotalus adamanteus]